MLKIIHSFIEEDHEGVIMNLALKLLSLKIFKTCKYRCLIRAWKLKI